MPDTMPLVLTAPRTRRADNPSHNVVSRIEAAKHRLSNLATLYLVTEVAGQSQETLATKRRDLQRFISFYQHFTGHDRPEEWFVSVKGVFEAPPTRAPGAGLAGAHLCRGAALRPLV